ncbi:cation channel family protein [Stylonychia lemnae]|uniref:Cation channel family protein n=1 Tax=Stylonychia lemnae TaxID=5949 RepID=A0A078ATT9_STYLE|nr:cation channel family protein [Stylonychia lemnae]|eukprot:CDW85371.1 cation channel family protein [Stylonychia lemnae]
MVSHNKFAYRSVLAQDNLILSKYSKQSTGSNNPNENNDDPHLNLNLGINSVIISAIIIAITSTKIVEMNQIKARERSIHQVKLNLKYPFQYRCSQVFIISCFVNGPLIKAVDKKTRTSIKFYQAQPATINSDLQFYQWRGIYAESSQYKRPASIYTGRLSQQPHPSSIQELDSLSKTLTAGSKKQRKTSVNIGELHFEKQLVQEFEYYESNSEEDLSSPTLEAKFSHRLRQQRQSISQANQMIDLEEPGYKHIDTYKSLQNYFGTKLRSQLDPKMKPQTFEIDQNGIPMRKNNTSSFKQNENIHQSHKDEDDIDEDQDNDLVTPGKNVKQKKKKMDEVEAAKQFILQSANPFGIKLDANKRRNGLMKNKTIKTEKLNGANDLLGEESDDSEEQEEEDSLKSDINTVELNRMDSQPFRSSRTGNMNIQRGNSKFKRQQMKISKKPINEDSKQKQNIDRKKSRILKRKQTLFKGENGGNGYDDNDVLNDQIIKDSQKLRDVYKFKKFIILPDDVFKERWEITIMLLLLFTAIVTPYRIAFTDTDDAVWSVIDNLTDGTFFVDSILQFFTAYQNSDEELIHDRRLIARKYIKSWFLIDLLSVMPINYMLSFGDFASLARLARLPKLYRLIKMAKLSRLLKVIKERNTISKYLNEVLKVSVGFERLSFFVLIFVISVHITSCFWVILADLQDNVYETWVYRSNMQDASDSELYLAAFYYTIVIVTTIGYGDITVRTPIEQVFCIMLLVVGVVSFSFAIGSLSSILSSLDAKAAKLKEKLQILSEIQSEYKIPYDLFRRLRLALRYDHSKNSQEQLNFLNELPQNLKVELSLVMHSELIKSVKFFKKKEPHFIAFVGPMLKPIKVEKDQYVYKEGDPIDEIYFLVSGQAGYALHQHDNLVYLIIDKGYYFGEIDFIHFDENGETDGKRKFSAKAIEDCDLLVLNKHDLLEADQEFNDVFTELFKNAMHRLKRTIKIKKDSIKFFEKQQKLRQHFHEDGSSHQDGEPSEKKVFRARLSQAPKTRSDFLFLQQKTEKFNKIRKQQGINQTPSLQNQKSLMLNMQQIDDGELDIALGTSSDSQHENQETNLQKRISRHDSILMSTLNKSDRVNNEIIMKTANFLSRQNSKFSQLSKNIKQFEEDKENNSNTLHSNNDLVSQTSEEEKKPQSIRNKRDSVLTLGSIAKSQGIIFRKGTQDKDIGVIQKQKTKTPSNAQQLVSQAIHGQEKLAPSSNKVLNMFAQRIHANIGKNSISSANNNNNEQQVMTESSDDKQGELRWNVLKTALNKKVQLVKQNQFQAPISTHGNQIQLLRQGSNKHILQQMVSHNRESLSSQLQQHQQQLQQQQQANQQQQQQQQQQPQPIFNQLLAFRGDSNNISTNFNSQAVSQRDHILQIQANNKQMFAQVNERIDKFENTIDKINNLIQLLQTNQQANQQHTDNINKTMTNFANSISLNTTSAAVAAVGQPNVTSQSMHQNNNSSMNMDNQNHPIHNTHFKEMIKKVLKEVYNQKNNQNGSNGQSQQ